MKTNFHKKNFALRLVLKRRQTSTRKWPINMEEFIGKDEAFVKDWLVRHGLEKLVDVFKGMFSRF